MNLDIKEKKENPLLERTELTIKIGNKGATPSEKEIIDKLSATLDADSELFSVSKIDQKFGQQESTAFVNLYNSKEAMEKVQPKEKEKSGKEEERDENVPDESGQIKVDLDEKDSKEKEEEKSEEEKTEKEDKEKSDENSGDEEE